MKRLLFCVAMVALLAYRRRQFDRSDRENGYGAYAPLAPQSQT